MTAIPVHHLCGRFLRGAAVALCLATLPLPAVAQTGTQPGADPETEARQPQEAPIQLPRSPVVVLDRDRLFSDSELGKRMARQLEASASDLAAENRRMEAELVEEERALSERRAGTEAAAFRAMADAFDQKVTSIRRAQEEKARALNQEGDAAQREFLSRAQPVLMKIMRETGAAVLLDSGVPLMSVEAVNVTDAAIAMIDRELPAEAADPSAPEGPAGETVPAQE